MCMHKPKQANKFDITEENNIRENLVVLPPLRRTIHGFRSNFANTRLDIAATKV